MGAPLLHRREEVLTETGRGLDVGIKGNEVLRITA